MNAFQVTNDFGFENIQPVEVPSEALGPHDVRVKLCAASLNYRDLLMVKGLYNPRQPLPLTPCSDGAGEVIEVGKNVSTFAVGDRVASCFFENWTAGEPEKSKLVSSVGGPVQGMLRREAVMHERAWVHAPKGFSHAEAATLPCAALTAWNALMLAGVKPGDTVLTQGTGGVSVFAIQFASKLGARVISTSSSDEKLERVRTLGAHETINYKTHPEWSREVQKLTNKRGVDIVVEVGGAGTLEQSIRSVRPGGTISLIGVLAAGKSDVNVIPVLMQQIRIQGVLVGHRESFLQMIRAIETFDLKPIISDHFSFDDAVQAFEHQWAGKHFGKVVVDI